MKTEFEEVYSDIQWNHERKEYDLTRVRIWFLGRTALISANWKDVKKLPETMFEVGLYLGDEYKVLEIPRRNIYAITHGKEFLFDNRKNYTGKKSMDIRI